MLFICFRYIIKTIIFSCLIINSCFAEGFIGIKDIEKSLGIKDQDDNNYIIDDLPTNLEKDNNKFIEDDLVSGMVYDLNNVEGLESREYAKIIVVNKITAKPQEVILKLGEVKYFGNISIEVRRCLKKIDPYEPDNLMLVAVFDNKIDEDQLLMFYSWIMSANSSVSNFEHSVYEIIPKDCISLQKKDSNNISKNG
ncbi:MAG: DUF2155 domain-containing protein [Rickettsiaceae bacterium]|nr:DUF2155 domain-containing protein [Rickettsiaceae bacterium]